MSIIMIYGLVMVVMGWWQLSMPTDELWRRYKHRLRVRGLAPQRTLEWEDSQRVSAWVMVGLGITIYVFAAVFMMVSVANFEQKPSSKLELLPSINGHKLTSAEWDACGHSIFTCPPWVKESINK